MAYTKTQPNEVGRESPQVGYRPTVAPKWDVLQRGRLAALDECDLDYRPQPIEPKKDRHFVIFIISVIGVLSLMLSMISPLAGAYLGTAYMFALFTAASAVSGVYAYLTERVLNIAIAYALVGPGLWLLAVSPQIIGSFKLISYLFFLASLGLCGYLAERTATHYAMWLGASPQLFGPNRQEAQDKWHKHSKERYHGFWLIGVYGILLIFFASTPILGYTNFLFITFLFVLGTLYWATGFQDIKSKLKLCREAIVSWFTYGRYQAMHPEAVEENTGDAVAGWFVVFTPLFPVVLLSGFGLIFISDATLKDFPPPSDNMWILIITFFILIFFLFAVRVAFGILYSAYQRNGTLFQHPVLPPGMFKSPGGSWMRRNLLAAAALFGLFTFTIQLTHYAPTMFLYGDEQPWMHAFGRVVDKRVSITSFLAKLHRYEPQTVSEIIKNLSYAEALNLKKLDPVSRQNYILKKQTTHYITSSPGAWMSLAVDSALMGNVQAIWALFLAIAQSLLLPVLIFLMTCCAIFARVLPRYTREIEDLKCPITDWLGYVCRLQNATSDLVREHLWLGAHATEDYPVLLHRNILSEHAHFLGDSGSGKTALGMAPLLSQLIKLGDSAVVVIDLKGDMAMFQTVQAFAGERFKFFTNEVGKATHVFNPFGLLASKDISLNQVCEVFLGALGLDHGEGYGRSYYSRVARSVLSRTIKEYPDIASFDELREKVGKMTTSADEQDAFELIAVIESLAEFEQLNYTASLPDPVAERAINMEAVVKNNEVVYFWLPAAIESATVREIAKLALYTLFSSTYLHQRQQQQTPRVWVFIDEFQHVASLNFKLILQQSRSMGMGMILANQTDSDLWTNDANLKDTVQANTRFKQIFSLSSPKERKELSDASGETIYYSGSLNLGGELGRFKEEIGPRLMENDIIELSDEKDKSIVIISRGEGYSQFGGYAFPLRGFYHITKEEYERRKNAPWPAPCAHTLVTRRKQKGEAGPSLAEQPLWISYILSENEPPPEVSEKVAASPWAKHLQGLYQAQQVPTP